MKLEGKQIGIYTALILAFIMLFLPSSDNSKYSFDPAVLAAAINDGQDHVSPGRLAEMIISEDKTFLLVDIRKPEDFQIATIKNAVNIPIEKLLKKETIERELPDDKTVIIFSNGNTHAHQAWLVLKAAGKNVQVLENGYNGWVQAVLTPRLPSDNTDDEILRYKRDKAVGGFLGGGVIPADVRKNETTNAQPQTGKPAAPKKKKIGGC